MSRKAAFHRCKVINASCKQHHSASDEGHAGTCRCISELAKAEKLPKPPSSFVDKLNFSNHSSTFWNSRNNFSITLNDQPHSQGGGRRASQETPRPEGFAENLRLHDRFLPSLQRLWLVEERRQVKQISTIPNIFLFLSAVYYDRFLSYLLYSSFLTINLRCAKPLSDNLMPGRPCANAAWWAACCSSGGTLLRVSGKAWCDATQLQGRWKSTALTSTGLQKNLGIQNLLSDRDSWNMLEHC